MAGGPLYAGARKISPEDLGAVLVSKAIGHHVQTDGVLVITNPDEDRVLFIQAEVGDWRHRPGDYAGRAFASGDVTPGSDSITITGHGYQNGEGPVRITSDGVDLPDGLTVDTDYFVIVVDANTIQLAATYENAVANVPVPVTINDAGTGNFVLGGNADGAGSGSGWANAAVPGASVADGYGSALLGSGVTIALSAGDTHTFVSFDAAGVLTYWFAGS